MVASLWCYWYIVKLIFLTSGCLQDRYYIVGSVPMKGVLRVQFFLSLFVSYLP